MALNEILTIVSIGTTLLVGLVLGKQVKAQSTIINHYKDLVAAYDIDNLKLMQKTQKDQIESIMSFDNETLRTQVLELARTLHLAIIVFESQHNSIGKRFDKSLFISSNTPHCVKLMKEIELSNNSLKDT